MVNYITPVEISEIKAKLNMNNAELGRLIGCTGSNFARWMSGQNTPTGQLRERLIALKQQVLINGEDPRKDNQTGWPIISNGFRVEVSKDVMKESVDVDAKKQNFENVYNLYQDYENLTNTQKLFFKKLIFDPSLGV